MHSSFFSNPVDTQNHKKIGIIGMFQDLRHCHVPKITLRSVAGKIRDTRGLDRYEEQHSRMIAKAIEYFQQESNPW